MNASQVTHEIDPVYNKHSRVLILGTIPSPKSREVGFYYGHPQNRFWKVLSTLFDEPIPETVEEKRDLCLRHHIALWDVLASCTIEGARDASIKTAQPNDLSRILRTAPIQAIFTTGTKAGQFYKKLCETETNIPCITLPSTSPANSRIGLPELCDTYRKALLPYLTFHPDYPVLSVTDVVRLEQNINASGTSLYTLMHRAGRFLAYEVANTLNSKTSNQQRIAILCGHGNNGGDGWVAAKYLVKAGYQVDVISPIPTQKIKAEPAHTTACEIEAELTALCISNENLRENTKKARNAASKKTSTENAPAVRIMIEPSVRELETSLSQADLIIDSILGTGFSGETVREPFATWINLANKQAERSCATCINSDYNLSDKADRQTENAIIVAADVPSGFSAQTGTAAKPCIKANHTVTMITLKTGLVHPNAETYCGTIRVAPLADFSNLVPSPAEKNT